MTTVRGRTAEARWTAAAGLLEREPELARLRAAIEETCAGTGSVALIEGPAGIGKTALLRAAREMAEENGMRVLRARATDVEQEFEFGVVRQLFETVLARADAEERTALYHGAAELAGPLFGPAVPEQRSAPDLSFTLVHGLYWLTANLAESGPVMIAVDDAHWADPSSLRFLSYLGARCEELPVLVVATVREGEPTRAQELLETLRGDPRVAVVEPSSLSEDAVTTLIRTAFGDGADPRFCSACAQASAGNPFLLRELVAELEAERVEPVAASAARVEGVRPDSVSRAVLARLSRLGRDASNLARAVAVLERASLRQAATLAGLDDERAGEAADRLISAEILVPSIPLAFVHPLLRRAIYEGIPPAARADGHRRAGLLLATEGSRRSRAGAHLLRSEPTGDPEVVELLRDAARDALADGAPQTAARLLARALREPPGDGVRGPLLAELGHAEALARDPGAVEHLSLALELSEDVVLRTRIACELGSLLVWVGRPLQGHAVVTQLLERVGDDAEPSLRASLEVVRAAAASVERTLVAEVEPRLPELRELAVSAGPPGRGLLILEGGWRAQSGPYDGDWRELFDRGLDDGRFLAEETAGSPVVPYAAAVLTLADEVERAGQLLAGIRAEARSRGSIGAHLTALTWGSLLALRGGELRQAESDARTALELAERHGVLWTKIWSTAFLTQALMELGALDEADALFADAPIDRVLGSSAALHALLARGRLRLAQGRRAEAVADLRAAGDGVIVNNPSYVPWRSILALALAGDDPAAARELAGAELTRARALGQPRGIGVALRACGLLVGGDDGTALLAEAVEVLRDSPARLELARALCDLGSALRRGGRRSDAREPLREALELAQRCDAEPLAERAREELLATGAHPRRERLWGPDALTPSERRVAELAASGLTNREIAQALFVTTKTVGTHLGRIYQKLDLQGARAREQIGERLGRD